MAVRSQTTFALVSEFRARGLDPLSVLEVRASERASEERKEHGRSLGSVPPTHASPGYARPQQASPSSSSCFSTDPL